MPPLIIKLFTFNDFSQIYGHLILFYTVTKFKAEKLGTFNQPGKD
jgi:hypothetical protein